MYSDDDLEGDPKSFLKSWKRDDSFLIVDGDAEEDIKRNFRSLEAAEKEEGNDSNSSERIVESIDLVRMYRVMRFFKILQGFYEGDLDLTGRHPMRLEELLPKWHSYLPDFLELAICAKRFTTIIEPLPGRKFEQKDYYFDDPEPLEKFKATWKIPPCLDFGTLLIDTKDTLRTIAIASGVVQFQKLCLVDCPSEVLDHIFSCAYLFDARSLSATCKQLRQIGLRHILSFRTIILKRERSFVLDLEKSGLTPKDYIATTALAVRDKMLAYCQFLLNRKDLLENLETLSIKDEWVDMLDESLIRDHPVSELDAGTFYVPFYRSIEHVISASTNLTTMALIYIKLGLDIINCLCNLPRLDYLALTMCRINKKARRTLSLAAPEVFTCSTRSLLLETENGDTSSWYSIIFCPNVINFSARSVGSMLLSPPPMVIWQKCRFPSILKYVYLGNLNTFQFSTFEEWIRQCLGGHDLQITHLKVEVQSGITDTQITSLLEAISTAPLEVLSVEGALQANLPLFDWIANHMPTLRALTIIRRDSTRSRKTNSITWPLHVGEYAQRLSSLPSLQHFGWNNCKASEQYGTYSLPFLEGAGIVDKDSVQLPYHDERLSPVDEYMPIVFGALCPTLQTLGLSFMNYRISRPSEGVIKAERDFSRRCSGEYDPHPLIEGCWPHRPSLSNT